MKTEDAIGQAPDAVDRKFVLSYSGKRPHLVVPKKEVVLLTVSIAKSWGSVLTLLFSVVVAEQCNKLPQCVKALKQAKKRPNIASLQRRLCLKEEEEREV